MLPPDPALDTMMREDLNAWSSLWFWVLVGSTIAVVIGIICEAPEVWQRINFGHKTIADIRYFWYIRVRKVDLNGWEQLCPELITERSERKWVATIGLIGWMLVAFGVTGEGVAEYFVNDAETDLRQFDDATLLETQKSANSAAAAASLANTFANDAVTASSKVLGLARGAREEADWAKNMASQAEAQLADRALTDEQVKAISGKLKEFSGQRYTVTAYWESKESMGIANRIHTALQVAQWSYFDEGLKSMMLGGVVGVLVWTHPDAAENTKKAASALISALHAEGLDAEAKVQNPVNNPKHNNISLSIGAKR